MKAIMPPRSWRLLPIRENATRHCAPWRVLGGIVTACERRSSRTVCSTAADLLGRKPSILAGDSFDPVDHQDFHRDLLRLDAESQSLLQRSEDGRASVYGFSIAIARRLSFVARPFQPQVVPAGQTGHIGDGPP